MTSVVDQGEREEEAVDPESASERRFPVPRDQVPGSTGACFRSSLLGSAPLGRTLRQEQERLALGLISGRATDAVDVRVDVFWCVDLDYPVDGGKVETPISLETDLPVALGPLRLRELPAYAARCAPHAHARQAEADAAARDKKTIVLVKRCVLMKLHRISSLFGRSTTM
jgi:hypothetical protein